ncbi:UNVERIFIED_CONTAM: protein HASTY 1 [Sesamum calycinum]|uniref:Protein HASTY 1 n=1 Tax=Sesamum calycinum TaxID=2727403 RepID=A0AAW2SXL4_9LAMI
MQDFLWNTNIEGLSLALQLELIRFIAFHKPLVAAAKVSERITEVIKSFMLVLLPTKDLAMIESMHLALENVVSAIFDGSNEYGKNSAEIQLSLHQIFEGLLQQLISLKWTEPTLVEVLGHYLDALGPFLRYYPDAVGAVINKLFELLTSLPFMVKDPSTSSARRARLQICTSFIRIAKTASESLLPHMKVLCCACFLCCVVVMVSSNVRNILYILEGRKRSTRWKFLSLWAEVLLIPLTNETVKPNIYVSVEAVSRAFSMGLTVFNNAAWPCGRY